MKKLIMISLCLTFIPSFAYGALCSGKYYNTIFHTAASEGSPRGTMAFLSNRHNNQGIISIEYASGDIGTGGYSSSMLFDVAGQFDFYDSNGNYHLFTFTGFSSGITILGIGDVQNIITGEVKSGFFFGLITVSP